MVLEPVSVALKFGFLLVLYLFLLWIARSTLRDLRGGVAPLETPPDATGMHSAVAGLGPDPLDGLDPRPTSGSRIRSRPRATPGSSARVTCS